MDVAAQKRQNLHNLPYQQLTQLLAEWGYSTYHADLLWQQLYVERNTAVSQMHTLRPDLLQKLNAHTELTQLHTQLAINSNDGHTRKFLLQLQDGETIETVLMKFKGRSTACVSTQVGCAMGCVFCATGQMGFQRHLTAGEIVAQILHLQRELAPNGKQLRNIVFMGMGEPLHNYDATMTALSILTNHKGLNFAPKHITLSTVGIVPGIVRMADERQPVRLAVSLHGATDAERQALVPPAKRWPLAELIEACRYYIAKRNQRIFFEWTLIAGENDTPQQAHALGKLLHNLDSHINLIPLNPTVGYDGTPTRETAVIQFQTILAEYNLPSTVRQRRGIDIAAGCGQLKADNENHPTSPHIPIST